MVLAEKDLPWEGVHVDLPNKANLEPEYLKLNPLGVVPTLVEDGKAVLESSIICEYLEDRYPEPSLKPSEPHQIARMRFWMKHVDNKLHPSCGALQWPLVMADKLRALPADEQERIINQVVEKPRRERQRRLLKYGYDAPDVADAIATYERTMIDMDAILESQAFIAGGQLSLADIALAPYFQTLTQFGWDDWYRAKTRVAHWYERVRARTSYQAGIASAFDEQTLADLNHRGRDAWLTITTTLAELGKAA